MSLPNEFAVEEVVRSIGDIIVYRADHPIHGTVNVYMPDDNLPQQLARTVKNRLYHNGLQMRDMAMQNIRYVAKALEVAQNPNEPYIATEYAKYNLEELISNGITMSVKRVFAILSQVLEAAIGTTDNGWVIDQIRARQIKLRQVHAGDISFSLVEGLDESVLADKADVMAARGKHKNAATSTVLPMGICADRTLDTAEATDRHRPPEDSAGAHAARGDVDPAAVSRTNVAAEDIERNLRVVQRNVYALGNIAYQLLFGRKYEPSDETAAANIKNLVGRWRRVLTEALGKDSGHRYSTYESMLKDVRRASSRNRRLAFASTPVWLLLAVIGGYVAHERYREYQIMTSEAGQAIEKFLDIVNKTQDEFPELEKPEPEPPKPDDEVILGPFNGIEPADEI